VAILEWVNPDKGNIPKKLKGISAHSAALREATGMKNDGRSRRFHEKCNRAREGEGKGHPVSDLKPDFMPDG
jgi:hypothetical protein